MIIQHIPRDNKTAIEELIKNNFSKTQYNRSSEESESIVSTITGPDFIRQLVKHINDDMTITIEEFHIDRFFRDSYYMYFSNQHFQINRYCKRIAFFKGTITKFDFLHGYLSDNKKKIISNLVAVCVIRPLSGGVIGKSLVNPNFVMISGSAYVRTSKYEVDILGNRISIDAFPYQMQDQETMRCSEVTLLNIMDYFSNSYNDYKITMPSDIVSLEKKHNHERVLPSRGINYHQLTKILSDLGFAPRLYNIKAIPSSSLSSVQQSDHLKRIMHYYIESGIPVAVNVEPKNRGVGHSIICIGHSSKQNFEKALGFKKYIGNSFKGTHAIINSADFYDEYVVMDDNQFPYKIRPFNKLSLYSDMTVTNISIPLYKRMFLEATDAYNIALMILESDKWGIFNLAKDYLSQEKNVIVRLFLASSRKFKQERVKYFSRKSDSLATAYAMLRLPRFVWVCEVYTSSGYEKQKCFAELVLDGTSALKKGFSNLILMNYPKHFYARNPIEDEQSIDKQRLKNKDWIEIESYTQNLTGIS